MAKGKVIAGDYNGYDIITFDNKCYFMLRLKRINVDKSVVAKYEVINDVENHSYWKSFAKGAVGGMLFGPVGMLAAVTSNSTKTSYLLSIEFNDGKKSLIEVGADEYKSILFALY